MVCAGVLALSGLACGSGGGDEKPAAEVAPAATWSAAQRAYLDGLGKIERGLVANEDRAIRRAEETCSDVKAGEITGAKLTQRVVDRLSGGDATIDAKQADQALALMKANIC